MGNKDLSPPIAKKKSHAYTIHDETITDDYFWLRDKKNSDVINYLEAENKLSKFHQPRVH